MQQFPQPKMIQRSLLWLLVVCLCSGGLGCLATSGEVLPCNNRSENFAISVYSGGETVAIPADLGLCQDITWNAVYNGFRITTIINKSEEVFNGSKPVVFVARQPTSEGIVTWNVPFDLQLNGTGISQRYLSISHTMCPFIFDNASWPHDADLSPLPIFYIDIFTHSKQSITYSVNVEPVQDFVISTANDSFSANVTPPSPQVFYYKIPDHCDTVTIEVTNASEAVGCIYVSVQNTTCPFNNLLLDSKGRGIYQSMTQSAFLTIKAEWVERHEFLLILAPANYSVCHDPPFNDTALSSFLTQGQEVNIQFGQSDPLKKFAGAIIFAVGIPLGVILLSSLAICCFYSHLCGRSCVLIQCKQIGMCYVCVPCCCKCLCTKRSNVMFTLCGDDNESDSPSGHVRKKTNDGSAHPGDINKHDAPSGDEGGVKETDPLLKKSTDHPYGASSKLTMSDTSANNELRESGVYRMSQDDQNDLKDRKRYLAYGWNTLIVGIFYSLPAFQLIFFQQRLLDQSGDQDLCYYNFLCAHLAPPGISAFNNVYSNICYCLLGLGFCCIVLYRHRQYNQKNKDPKNEETYGVAQYFGIYYALGIALVLEGFMSAFYHICPTNANFQFDTAFMYIIGGLLLIKVFQNRHPDMNASAFVAFFCFALIIFFTVVGIYNDQKHPLIIKLAFLVFLVVFILPFILISFYTLKYYQRKLLKKIANTKCGEIKHHLCKWYTLRHVIIVLINVGVAIGMVVKNSDIGIATVVLTFIVMNVVLYLVLYFVLKVLNREPLTLLAMFLPILIGLSWIGAFFFYGTVTEWEKPPAESRAMNQKCSLFGFYDKHDIWHMLSAFGMFFTFLFVLVIDDGVANCERKKLKIF